MNPYNCFICFALFKYGNNPIKEVPRLYVFTVLSSPSFYRQKNSVRKRWRQWPKLTLLIKVVLIAQRRELGQGARNEPANGALTLRPVWDYVLRGCLMRPWCALVHQHLKQSGFLFKVSHVYSRTRNKESQLCLPCLEVKKEPNVKGIHDPREQPAHHLG